MIWHSANSQSTMKYQKQKLGKKTTGYGNLKNKVPRNKPNQGGKRPYSENYTTLKKDNKENTNKWKTIPCSWIGRINIIKISILPKIIYRFDTTLIKIPVTYFTNIEQAFHIFIWNHK